MKPEANLVSEEHIARSPGERSPPVCIAAGPRGPAGFLPEALDVLTLELGTSLLLPGVEPPGNAPLPPRLIFAHLVF